jgi:predicted site-specific integrase-resolvase
MTQTAKPAEKIGYASVSGHDQKADLETQAQRLRDTDAMRSSRALVTGLTAASRD